jgi:hypothetical protein
MTIADLKDLLAEYPDHYPVEVEDTNGVLLEIYGLERGKVQGVNLVRIITADPD